MMRKFQVPSSKFQVHNPRWGLSLLDLLIALMVLALVLLAAVHQFNVYDKPAAQPVPPAQPAPSQPQQQ